MFLKNAGTLLSLNFREDVGCGSDVARMWLGYGSDVARMWLGCGSDVARTWLRRVFGCGRKRLAEVKGKRFPALQNLFHAAK